MAASDAFDLLVIEEIVSLSSPPRTLPRAPLRVSSSRIAEVGHFSRAHPGHFSRALKEQAYSEAERYHGGHAHHWFGRGINHLFLGQLKCARAALEKCIGLTKEEAHVEAKYLLAVCLMALDEKREGQRLGKRVEHVTGTNPAKHWREIIRGRFHLDVPD